MLERQELMIRFETVRDLDSMAFVEIPQRDIIEPWQYRKYLIKEVEIQWMKEFNNNQHYYPQITFNDENGIHGYFGEISIEHSKLYRYDGTLQAYREDDYRAKRGFLIRDHYGTWDVVKVQLIADNLTEFLRQEKIEHSRRDFKKDR